MKVLLVEPMRHPREADIPDTLEAMYEILQCRTITAVCPWEEPMVLVTDDEGMLSEKMPCRYVRELGQPIMGSFFLCGVSGEDFADLPEGLMRKYMERFWMPECIMGPPGEETIIRVDDGTAPE